MKNKFSKSFNYSAAKAFVISLATANLLVLSAAPAYAYIGPGAGITAIGTVLALIGAVFLAIVGFLWYPIKRLLKKRRGHENEVEATEPSAKDAAE